MNEEEKRQYEMLQWRNSVDYKLSRILNYLENDEKTGRKGYLNIVNDNEKRLDKIETTDKIRKGQIAVIATIGGMVSSIAFWFIKEILTKD